MATQATDFANENRGPQLTAIYWVLCGLSIVVIVLRVIGRYLVHGFGMDDYTMIFTLILFIALTCFVTFLASIGGSKHLSSLNPAQQEQAVKYNWVCQPWAIMGFATGKASVGYLILRLLGTNPGWRKWFLHSLIILTVAIAAVNVVLTFAQCNPPRALWERQLVISGQATCWNPSIQNDYALFSAAWNIFADIALTLFPITLFWNLKMDAKKKAGLCVLLGLSVLAAVAGSVKMSFLTTLNARSDLTWDTYDLFAWSAAELFVIIFCGSVPPIKPVYSRLFGDKKHTRRGYIQEGRSDYNHHHKYGGEDTSYSLSNLTRSEN